MCILQGLSATLCHRMCGTTMVTWFYGILDHCGTTVLAWFFGVFGVTAAVGTSSVPGVCKALAANQQVFSAQLCLCSPCWRCITCAYIAAGCSMVLAWAHPGYTQHTAFVVYYADFLFVSWHAAYQMVWAVACRAQTMTIGLSSIPHYLT